MDAGDKVDVAFILVAMAATCIRVQTRKFLETWKATMLRFAFLIPGRLSNFSWTVREDCKL